MKKIAVLAESMPEFASFVYHLPGEQNLTLDEVNKKYHYVNPNDYGRHRFEGIAGYEFSDILIASPKLQVIIDAFLTVKSRIR